MTDQLMIQLTETKLIRIAADLLADPSAPNPEYDRAIGELVTDLLGLSMDDMPDVLQRMREMPR